MEDGNLLGSKKIYGRQNIPEADGIMIVNPEYPSLDARSVDCKPTISCVMTSYPGSSGVRCHTGSGVPENTCSEIFSVGAPEMMYFTSLNFLRGI